MIDIQQFQKIAGQRIGKNGNIEIIPIYDTAIKDWFIRSVKRAVSEETLSLSSVKNEDPETVIDAISNKFDNIFERKFAAANLNIAFADSHYQGFLVLAEIDESDASSGIASSRENILHTFELRW